MTGSSSARERVQSIDEGMVYLDGISRKFDILVLLFFRSVDALSTKS